MRTVGRALCVAQTLAQSAPVPASASGARDSQLGWGRRSAGFLARSAWCALFREPRGALCLSLTCNRGLSIWLCLCLVCVPSQGKTILGCTCLPEWSVPQRPATVVMEPPGLGNCHGPYKGCPPTPCDGDDGGEAGLSWCYTKPPCVRPWGYCSPHGGPAAKQPGPQPGASAVSWKERHAMTISGEADVYSGGTNFTEAACKQLCTRSARCHAAVFGLPSTVQ